MGCNSSKAPLLPDVPCYTEKVSGQVFNEELTELPNKSKRNIISWLPENVKPKATVFISHGLHEHGLRYYNLAQTFVEKEYAVFAIDHYAHGKSVAGGDKRGLIDDYRKLPDDFVSFVTFVRSKPEFKELPCYVFAHSMGTLVASLSIPKLSNVEAAVFSGVPLIAGPGASSPFGIQSLYFISRTSAAVTLTRGFAYVAPTGDLAPVVLEEVTSSREEQDILLQDPRRYDKQIMNKTGYELLQMIAEVRQIAPSIVVPFYCIHGEKDIIATTAGMEEFFDLAGTDASLKIKEVFPNLKHEVIHEVEPHAKVCIDKIVQYFENQYESKFALSLHPSSITPLLLQEDKDQPGKVP